MIRAYLDLSPFWAMIVSLIYLTCFLAIFFLLDYLFFIDSTIENWRYWDSSLGNGNGIKGYPLYLWAIFFEIAFGSFFILRYFFILFPNLLLKLSDLFFGGISEVIFFIYYLKNEYKNDSKYTFFFLVISLD